MKFMKTIGFIGMATKTAMDNDNIQNNRWQPTSILG